MTSVFICAVLIYTVIDTGRCVIQFDNITNGDITLSAIVTDNKNSDQQISWAIEKWYTDGSSQYQGSHEFQTVQPIILPMDHGPECNYKVRAIFDVRNLLRSKSTNQQSAIIQLNYCIHTRQYQRTSSLIISNGKVYNPSIKCIISMNHPKNITTFLRFTVVSVYTWEEFEHNIMINALNLSTRITPSRHHMVGRAHVQLHKYSLYQMAFQIKDLPECIMQTFKKDNQSKISISITGSDGQIIATSTAISIAEIWHEWPTVPVATVFSIKTPTMYPTMNPTTNQSISIISLSPEPATNLTNQTVILVVTVICSVFIISLIMFVVSRRRNPIKNENMSNVDLGKSMTHSIILHGIEYNKNKSKN